jgi:hypothetical protein
MYLFFLNFRVIPGNFRKNHALSIEEVFQRSDSKYVFPTNIGSLPKAVDKKQVDGCLQVHLLELDMLFTADVQPFSQGQIPLIILTADVSQQPTTATN